MKTKVFVPAVLAMAIGCTSLCSANAASYTESADSAKDVPVTTSAPEKSASRADDLNAQMSMDARYSAPPRGAKQDSAGKSQPGPAKIFQLRDAAGG